MSGRNVNGDLACLRLTVVMSQIMRLASGWQAELSTSIRAFNKR